VSETTKSRLAPWLASAGLLLALLVGMGAPLADSGEPMAAQLRARHDALREQLARSPFGKPVHLESHEESNKLTGDVFAVVDHPFATVAQAFHDAADWCHVLILPFNTKHCTSASADELSVRIGRKSDQPAETAFRIAFRYRVAASTAGYFRAALNADAGPVGTRNYRISLEATPLDAQRTFIHLSYSYGFGTMSRLMMQTYLGTAGSGKIGFTVTGRDAGGKPVYVDGMLGAVERNTMRYFLAIDAYLAALAVPASERLEKRLQTWYDATEAHARQLHDVERDAYLQMKRREYRRQQAALQ